MCIKRFHGMKNLIKPNTRDMQCEFMNVKSAVNESKSTGDLTRIFKSQQNFHFKSIYINKNGNDVKKDLRKCKTKEEFAEKIKSHLMYYFWSKCEYEVVISSFPVHIKLVA